MPDVKESKVQESESTESYIAKKKRPKRKDVRIAVIGNVDSGKSTMIGVLSSGELDDGRGYARSKVLRHDHEQVNGRTSCAAQHIFGFKANGERVHNPVAVSAAPQRKNLAWNSVVQNSSNIITFIDLAGHEKYLKTTISGLTGCFPDFALIVVGANMGISKMTREHIQVAVALDIPLFVVITKIDISPKKVLDQTKKNLSRVLRQVKSMPIQCKTMKDIEKVFTKDPKLHKICPVFLVSAVTNVNIDNLYFFLKRLKPRKPWKHKDTNDEGVELEIDETFAVRGVGIVVSGTITSGYVRANQRLFMGPFSDGSFKEIIVKSVHVKRNPVPESFPGQACSIAFRFVKRKEMVDRCMIRKGMCLLSADVNRSPIWRFQCRLKVLHHPTLIKCGYQPVVHTGSIRQTATILEMTNKKKVVLPHLRSGDSAITTLQFLCHPEYIHVGRAIIIREGATKCIGKIIQVHIGAREDLPSIKQSAVTE